ncbi:MAG TPA: glycosyltransferase family 2 protein [Saprospiraceae bacterium]|nr:glycosyltransferase family 2 protein [Saprospiraceae bacterium]
MSLLDLNEKQHPVVSIITTSFNSSLTIADTLVSIFVQDYPCIEHIIVDGGSADNTIEIVKEFSHVKMIISEKDNGIYDAMNKGIKACTGDIIGILNSDDFYPHPSVISRVVRQLEKENTQALYGDLVYVSPQDINKRLRTWLAGSFKPSKFLYGWMPPHPTFFVRREIYEKWGLFNLSLHSAADYELMLRFLYKHRISVSYLPEIIVKMRAGGVSNASLSNRIKANKEDAEAWRINGLTPRIYTSWLKPLRKLSQFIHL